MQIISIDTCTEACSVAVQKSSGEIIERFTVAPRQHTKIVLGMLDECLKEAKLSREDIEGIIVSRGPGSFTGVRIGLAVAQGLAYGLGIKVKGVSTLLLMAYQAYLETKSETILACIDARMAQVYWASYQFEKTGKVKTLVDENLLAPHLVTCSDEIKLFVGTGISHLSVDPQLHDCITEYYPKASTAFAFCDDNVLCGSWMEPQNLTACYLRDNVAQKSKKGS